MKKNLPIKITLFIFVLAVSLCHGGLVHRYSFDTDASDSVGSADGVIINQTGGVNFSDGSIILGNNGSQVSGSGGDYVDLPNGIISSLGVEATFEVWMTWNGSGNWQRVFDFGTSDGGEDVSIASGNSSYIFLTPKGGGTGVRLGWRHGPTVSENIIDGSSLTAGQHHIAVVWYGRLKDVILYIDGVEAGRGMAHFSLSEMIDNNNWLGRSQWVDTMLVGGINEFRIYDFALSENLIQANYQAGPDSLAFYEPTEPTPANYAQGVATGNVQLSWQYGGEDVTGFDVYFGVDRAAVDSASSSTAGIYQGQVTGEQRFYEITGLERERVYYWRVDALLASGQKIQGTVWEFETESYLAELLYPQNGRDGIPANQIRLEWIPGYSAAGYRLWLGQTPEGMSLVADHLTDGYYVTGQLAFYSEYYWRLDAMEAGGGITQGEQWHFKTISKPGPCLPGDLSGNCVVDIADLMLLIQQWLDQLVCEGYDCPDLDRSAQVNIGDYSVMSDQWLNRNTPKIVINEIHYHEGENNEPVEFIELLNAGVQYIDLSGWQLSDAVSYTFPAGTMMEPGEFIVVAGYPEAVYDKFGVTALGPWDGKLSNEGERIILRNNQGEKVDQVEYGSAFPWPVAANGEGASMELIHPDLDNDLGGSWRASGYHEAEFDLAYGVPTPGFGNSVFSPTIPPQIRQVSHRVINPLINQNRSEPRSGQAMLITAKVTDPDGVASVEARIQIVAPGAFIPAYLPVGISSLLSQPHQRQPINPAFENAANWTTMTMYDDGTHGDEAANDNTYSVIVNGQPNRYLLRYRIVARDGHGTEVRVPYYDDGRMNFAAFYYDGVPDYVITRDTVQPQGVGYAYPSEVMTSVPVYFMLTRGADYYQCSGYSSGDQINQSTTSYNNQEAGKAYNWECCFVYDGEVYDHVAYRARGGNGRYYGNKRSMKFRFNRGDYFQARDIHGKKFPERWQHLVTGKMFGNRMEGFYGLNELIDMKLWNIAGLPAPEGYWFHFRVIDGAEEAPTGTYGQYQGDFHGIYIAWEDYDGAFLDNHGMPAGNLYKLSDKIYEGYRQLRYQAQNAVTEGADYEFIRWNLNASATADQVRAWLDTDAWYRYKTVSEAIRHYDLFSGPTCFHCLKNVAWYFYPNYTPANNQYGQLWVLPFDVDDTWGPYWNMGVDHATAAVYDQAYNDGLVQLTIQPEKASIRQELRNTIREFRDLHWQPEVIDYMLDEMVNKIAPLVSAERDRWRLNPTEGGSRDDGSIEAIAAKMKQFAWESGVWSWPGTDYHLDELANAEGDAAALPATPVITYAGSPGYPLNDLKFSTTAFSDPQGANTFAALQWRIAEIDPDLAANQQSSDFVLIEPYSSWRYFEGRSEPSTEPGAWRLAGYNDNPATTSWKEGPAPVGYDPAVSMGSPLTMRNQFYTFYMRRTFQVTHPEDIAQLRFFVLYDDGFNIWINGHRVLSANVPQENLPYNALLSQYGYPYRGDENTYDAFIVENVAQYLVEGENQIAVHVINVDAGSSDCFFDMKLAASYEEQVPVVPTLKKRAYELQPVWQSGEIDRFDSQVTIPGSVLQMGRLYRVRCQMKDNTGRWSHWSSPVQFVAGTPLGAGLVQNLRLTELMYNPLPMDGSPVDSDEYEFIEFQNTGMKLWIYPGSRLPMGLLSILPMAR